MDRISSQVEFSFQNLRSTVEDPGESWQLLLRIVASFSTSLSGRQFYIESEFPVVEFASQAAKWLRTGGDFIYISMESEEDPLLGFYRVGNDQFRPYVAHSLFADSALVDAKELFVRLSWFVESVVSCSKSKLELDVQHFCYRRDESALVWGERRDENAPK